MFKHPFKPRFINQPIKPKSQKETNTHTFRRNNPIGQITRKPQNNNFTNYKSIGYTKIIQKKKMNKLTVEPICAKKKQSGLVLSLSRPGCACVVLAFARATKIWGGERNGFRGCGMEDWKRTVV
jgi:hypothetical protein